MCENLKYIKNYERIESKENNRVLKAIEKVHYYRQYKSKEYYSNGEINYYHNMIETSKEIVNNNQLRATTYQEVTKRNIKKRVSSLLLAYVNSNKKRKNKNTLICKLSDLEKLESGWDQTATRYFSKLHRRKRTEKSEEKRHRRERRKNLFFRGRR